VFQPGPFFRVVCGGVFVVCAVLRLFGVCGAVFVVCGTFRRPDIDLQILKSDLFNSPVRHLDIWKSNSISGRLLFSRGSHFESFRYPKSSSHTRSKVHRSSRIDEHRSLLCRDCAVIRQRLRNIYIAIAQRLPSDCAALAQ
jgi:hypothetical protein